MKKKLLSLLLALAMVFTLAACGEKKARLPARTPPPRSRWSSCTPTMCTALFPITPR